MLPRAVHSVFFAAALAAAACTEPASLAPVALLPPLADQQWYVHRSSAEPVPAVLAARPVGGLVEQDVLDSSRLELRADGEWTHIGWVQRFLDGAYQRSTTTRSSGRWIATPHAYELRDASGVTIYTIPGPPGDTLALTLVYPSLGAVAPSVMQRTPAPRTVAGRWRAATMNGEPLSALYFSRAEVRTVTGLASRHVVIDSAMVTLQPNNRYAQEVFYSEWEGPANGARAKELYREVAVDFGTWSRTPQRELLLESAWLPNKRITGASTDSAATLQLVHGITQGDAPVMFGYRR